MTDFHESIGPVDTGQPMSQQETERRVREIIDHRRRPYMPTRHDVSKVATILWTEATDLSNQESHVLARRVLGELVDAGWTPPPSRTPRRDRGRDVVAYTKGRVNGQWDGDEGTWRLASYPESDDAAFALGYQSGYNAYVYRPTERGTT